jgi:hypothetical protein
LEALKIAQTMNLYNNFSFGKQLIASVTGAIPQVQCCTVGGVGIVSVAHRVTVLCSVNNVSQLWCTAGVIGYDR